MLNRRQAVVGYATYVLARRVARRAVRRKLEDLRPFSGANGTEVVRERGGRMLKRSNGAKAARRTREATAAGAGKASALIEAVRPLIERAASDHQLHAAIRNALATGREVSSQVSGKKPSKAARKLADDRKLQRRALASVTELRDAVTGVVKEPKKKKGRKLFGVVAAIAAVAAAVPFLKSRLNGNGGGEDHGQNGGYAG
jgi:hypothetical protein